MTELTQTIAILVAGTAAPIVTQLIKVRLGWKDFKAFALAVAISWVLALGVMIYTGAWTPGNLVLNLGTSFAVATLIFKTFKYAQEAQALE